MSIVFVLISISLLMALGFLASFIWAEKSGQMDDLYTPSIKILLDNNQPEPTNNTSENEHGK